MHVRRPGWGISVCGSCSVVGLRWWADVHRACAPFLISYSLSCLLMKVLTFASLCHTGAAQWWHTVWCGVCGIFASCMSSALLGGLLPCASGSVLVLRWWAGISRARVPSMVSCSSFGLPMSAQQLRLFVKHRSSGNKATHSTQQP